MTLAIYYSLIFFASLFFYLMAVHARIEGKPTEYIYYFFLFLIVLFLV